MSIWLHFVGSVLSQFLAIDHASHLVSTLFIGVLLTYIKVSHWANDQSRADLYVSFVKIHTAVQVTELI